MLDEVIRDQSQRASDQLRGQLLFGRVSKAPATVNDDLFVVVPQLDPRLDRGPAVWTPKGASLPQQGAACALMLDDRDRPWVVGWDGPVIDVTPQCKLVLTAAVAIPNDANTLIGDTTGSWAEEHDLGTPDGMHTPDDFAIVVRRPGLYRALAQVAFQSNSTGSRGGRIRRQRGAVVRTIAACELDAANDSHTQLPIVGDERMQAGDRVLLEVFQTSGAPLNLLAEGGSSAGTSLSLELVSP